jgi:hypothetical protein
VRLLAGFTDGELRQLRDFVARMDANLKVTPAEVVRRAVFGSGVPVLTDERDLTDGSAGSVVVPA